MLQLTWSNDCYNQVHCTSCYSEAGRKSCHDKADLYSCYDKAGRNSCNDEAGLNSCYNKAGRNSYYDEAGRIGILLRILHPAPVLSQTVLFILDLQNNVLEIFSSDDKMNTDKRIFNNIQLFHT